MQSQLIMFMISSVIQSSILGFAIARMSAIEHSAFPEARRHRHVTLPSIRVIKSTVLRSDYDMLARIRRIDNRTRTHNDMSCVNNRLFFPP